MASHALASTSVAIVGLSCRVPSASNAGELWRLLIDGRQCISKAEQYQQQSEAIAFELNATSDGRVTGIEVVARILSSDSRMNVGLVSSTLRYPDGMDRRMGGALFGDGAATAVISKKSGFARLIVSQRTSNPDFEMLLSTSHEKPRCLGFP